MSLKILMITSLISIIPVNGFSLQRSSITPLEAIRSKFSSKFHNRIVFEGAEVVQAISTAKGVDLKAEGCSGQMFLTTNGKSISNALISFVLDTGSVQDVLIDFVPSVPSEVLLIDCSNGSFNSEEECEIKPIDVKNPSYISSIIKSGLSGECPEEFESVPFSRYQRVISRNVELNRIGKFQSKDLIVYLYEVCNLRNKSVNLSETELRHEGGVWVYLEKNKLKSGEKALALVAINPSE